jgi:hypothetical protein
MMPLRHAFKEWAVICQALAQGRQALILRKGGIAETQGAFAVEHKRFWLYPTYVHQQESAVVDEALPLLRQAEAERPVETVVRLSHFAEVAGIYHLHDIVGVLKLDGLHVWSRDTVVNRFLYREPGLFALAVRVYRTVAVVELPETPAYAGCRSWVDLGRELSTEGAVPVLDERAFHDVMRELDRRLEPTALV